MASFIDTFTGQPVQPSQVSYIALALTADATLTWPLEAASGTNIAALIINVTPSAGTFALTMPDATLTSPGTSILFVNKSMAFDFTLKDNSGAVITVLTAGFAYYVYLTDNSTAAGVWDDLVFGGSSAPVNPAALAGAGLQVISSRLNSYLPVTTRAAGWTVAVPGGRAIHNNYTGGAGVATFPAVATATNGFWFTISNQGSGALVLTPQAGELIDGSATLTLGVGEEAGVTCSGGGWFTFSLSRSLLAVITKLNLALVGGTYTLSAAEAANALIYVTGILASNQSIVFPGSTGRWFMSNETSGAYTLTCKVTGGDPGTDIPQAEQRIIMSDGTNMIPAMTTTPIAPTSFAAGLAVAPSIYLTAHPGTGFYFPTNSAGAFTADGAEVFRMAATGLLVNSVSLTDASNNVPWARLSTSVLPYIQAYALSR